MNEEEHQLPVSQEVFDCKNFVKISVEMKHVYSRDVKTKGSHW